MKITDIFEIYARASTPFEDISSAFQSALYAFGELYALNSQGAYQAAGAFVTDGFGEHNKTFESEIIQSARRQSLLAENALSACERCFSEISETSGDTLKYRERVPYPPNPQNGVYFNGYSEHFQKAFPSFEDVYNRSENVLIYPNYNSDRYSGNNLFYPSYDGGRYTRTNLFYPSYDGGRYTRTNLFYPSYDNGRYSRTNLFYPSYDGGRYSGIDLFYSRYGGGNYSGTKLFYPSYGGGCYSRTDLFYPNFYENFYHQKSGSGNAKFSGNRQNSETYLIYFGNIGISQLPKSTLVYQRSSDYISGSEYAHTALFDFSDIGKSAIVEKRNTSHWLNKRSELQNSDMVDTNYAFARSKAAYSICSDASGSLQTQYLRSESSPTFYLPLLNPAFYLERNSTVGCATPHLKPFAASLERLLFTPESSASVREGLSLSSSVSLNYLNAAKTPDYVTANFATIGKSNFLLYPEAETVMPYKSAGIFKNVNSLNVLSYLASSIWKDALFKESRVFPEEYRAFISTNGYDYFKYSEAYGSNVYNGDFLPSSCGGEALNLSDKYYSEKFAAAALAFDNYLQREYFRNISPDHIISKADKNFMQEFSVKLLNNSNVLSGYISLQDMNDSFANYRFKDSKPICEEFNNIGYSERQAFPFAGKSFRASIENIFSKNYGYLNPAVNGEYYSAPELKTLTSNKFFGAAENYPQSETSLLRNIFHFSEGNNFSQASVRASDISGSAVSKQDIEYMLDIAQRDVINRFTTAEIAVNLGGVTNTVTREADLDGIVNYLAEEVRCAMRECAEGVHA